MTPAQKSDADELPPVLRASLVAATAAYAAGVAAERARVVAALLLEPDLHCSFRHFAELLSTGRL